MNQSTTSKKETDSLKNKRADAELNSAGKKKTPFIFDLVKYVLVVH
jgi:hypothetical protein